jgi:hypothetical protein
VGRVEILLWLVPPLVAGVLAMVWVGWLSRPGRGYVDPDEALRRVGVALDREPPPFWGLSHETDTTPAGAEGRSTGVARRRS